MSPEVFNALVAQGYNRIPLFREIIADLDTPLSSYLKLADGPYSYLLESVQGGEKWGRYSMIGLPAATVVRACGNTVTVETSGQVVETVETDDPLAFVEAFQQRFKVAEIDGLPRFTGGLVGYFGYDCVRYVEPKLRSVEQIDTIGTPDILLMVSDEVLVFDNFSGTLTIVLNVDPAAENSYEQGLARLDVLEAKLYEGARNPGAIALTTPGVRETQFTSSFGEDNFQRAVEEIKEYVLAGDIMQVVISQRLSIPFAAQPMNLYRALRSLNPSPYMYFLNLGDHHVVGCSPEILARLESGEVTVRPIAGTRRRGHTRAEDLALEKDLLNDPKEIAEHVMLIDLGRNDVGRVSETGSVTLTDRMVVERYSHVMHITSNVTGRLREGLSAIDVLKAALPAGTLSGAPKIRAMEIIDELEQEKRGIYGGAVGYLSWSGNMDTAIAIRTAVIKDETLYIQAGAGIVADSVPALEWKETMNKARAIFRGVEMVLAGERRQ